MRTGTLPPSAAIRPWFGVGELVRGALPLARVPSIDPAEEVGAVGQPYLPPPDPRIGLPRMNESTLIQAYRKCPCDAEPERLAWEDWTPGQWEWFRRRQRVMARRTLQQEARTREDGAA